MRWPGRVVGAFVLLGSVAAYAQVTTPLIDAVRAADVRAVRDILRRDPASVNVTVVDGTTAWSCDFTKYTKPPPVWSAGTYALRYIRSIAYNSNVT